MAITHSLATRNALADTIKAQAGASAEIVLKAANDAVLGTVVVNFADGASGELAVTGTPISFTFSGTGDCAKFDLTTSGGVVVYSGEVGPDITVSPVGANDGQNGTLSNYKWIAPQ